jgi:hypothetical protein
MFPSAQFVFVHRDKESVVASMTRKDTRAFVLPIAQLETNDDLRACAETVWDECQKVCAQERSSANWFEVRYENLVSSPRETLAELYRALGLEGPDERIISIIDTRKARKLRPPKRKAWWAV